MAQGKREKGLLVVATVSCIPSFFYLTYVFVAPVNVIVWREIDVALGVFARCVKSYRIHLFLLGLLA